MFVAVLPMTACDQDTRQPSGVGAEIDRGLGFLVKDAPAWKNEHKCASCQHAGLVVWAMRKAKLHGHAVNEPVPDTGRVPDLSVPLARFADVCARRVRRGRGGQDANDARLAATIGVS